MDERLWRGAYEQGWRVYIKGKRNDGHYWYVTPKGRRLGSKTEALSLGVQRKQPTSRSCAAQIACACQRRHGSVSKVSWRCLGSISEVSRRCLAP